MQPFESIVSDSEIDLLHENPVDERGIYEFRNTIRKRPSLFVYAVSFILSAVILNTQSFRDSNEHSYLTLTCLNETSRDLVRKKAFPP